MEPQLVHFRSGDEQCVGDLYLPENMQGAQPALVIGHGFNMVKEALREQAAYLAKAGYVVLAIDYRRFGASEGLPRQLMRPLDEVEDFRNAISYLQDRPDVDPDRIGIWGVSFGGGVVLQVAAVDRRVKCVVAQSPAYLDGRQATKSLYGAQAFAQLQTKLQEDHLRRFRTGTGERVPCMVPVEPGVFPVMPGDTLSSKFMKNNVELFDSYRFEIPLESLEHMLIWAPMNFVEHIAPTPLRIVTNGGYDIHHALDSIQEAYRRAGEPKDLSILNYDVVGLYIEPGRGEAMRLAIDWFDKYLLGVGPFGRSGP
ncbi:conserved protein of unknown function [Georgfuchsia toluolica]|uniref:Serine aminopeptidase S33 domain-containing protein n=1 Tax=Georgfuchsia toluolica TaxID=424218 RepID=A0A916N3A8_9PROT|nr:alpha/beta fold hydrolase [Georgfuchsia toluolica]CAG4884799.1 conserved protein of unknown function [Georgfuchsia toluolica]